jgi:hypothetical protein
MARLPPIPDRPTDRSETWAEYQARRSSIALHRGLLYETKNLAPGAGFWAWYSVDVARGADRGRVLWIDEDLEWPESGAALLTVGEAARQFEALPQQFEVALPKRTARQPRRICGDGGLV